MTFQYIKRKIVFFLFLMIVFTINSCAIFQPITEPTDRIIRRGSCIGFDIPPITLTPVETAAERQILGDNVRIEADGWLISSAQSKGYIATNEKNTYKEEADADFILRHYIEAGVLDYYESNLNEYRGNHIIGEGFDGMVKLIPFSVSKKGNKEERELANKIIAEVNRSRLWIYEYYLSTLKKDSDTYSEEQDKIKKAYLYSYFEKGLQRLDEWVYTGEKKWIQTNP